MNRSLWAVSLMMRIDYASGSVTLDMKKQCNG